MSAGLDELKLLRVNLSDALVVVDLVLPSTGSPPDDPPDPPAAVGTGLRGFSERGELWYRPRKARPTRDEATVAAACFVAMCSPNELTELGRAVLEQQECWSQQGDAWSPPKTGHWGVQRVVNNLIAKVYTLSEQSNWDKLVRIAAACSRRLHTDLEPGEVRSWLNKLKAGALQGPPKDNKKHASPRLKAALPEIDALIRGEGWRDLDKQAVTPLSAAILRRLARCS